ncbi:hypothetical protein D9757_006696 [Collybiopsis confluens]|uniref:Uncharacterized protein n=1 Tax=Collybiopsis confluens TaxID=2823264 RepID=A0A8H5HN82_9AGAR|nr:hypothetical protein D9757_006696 [Collybiopsis confluens]
MHKRSTQQKNRSIHTSESMNQNPSQLRSENAKVFIERVLVIQRKHVQQDDRSRTVPENLQTQIGVELKRDEGWRRDYELRRFGVNYR